MICLSLIIEKCCANCNKKIVEVEDIGFEDFGGCLCKFCSDNLSFNLEEEEFLSKQDDF